MPLTGPTCQDDGDLCTDDICETGVCTHLEKNCDDGDPCTEDLCNAGVCQHPPKCPGFKAAGGKLVQPVCCEGECCAAGYLCCEGMCCSEERCCTADLCCDQACEGCIASGSLSGGTVTVSPLSVVCLGDTITFTAGGVVDSGGVKRIDCNSKTAVDPVTPSYTWRITKPDGTTVPPAGSGPGAGATATVVADMCGTYSCTFTASAERDCPPAPYGPAPATKTLEFTATLTLDPSSIAATTGWPDIPPGINQSQITVTWDPPECEGTLEIVDLEPQQAGGYLPADEGTLTRDNSTTWRYDSFAEALAAVCAGTVKVWIAAMGGDYEYTRKSILVHSVHTFLTTGANADFQMDYDYITWRYAAVLATTGGGFTPPVGFSEDYRVYCGTWPYGTYGYACTTLHPLNGTYTVEFGTSTFTGTENQAASIIGHELVHTIGADDCPAYTWEFNHDAATGIFRCDTSYLAEVVQMMNCKCSGINCPEKQQ